MKYRWQCGACGSFAEGEYGDRVLDFGEKHKCIEKPAGPSSYLGASIQTAPSQPLYRSTRRPIRFGFNA